MTSRPGRAQSHNEPTEHPETASTPVFVVESLDRHSVTLYPTYGSHRSAVTTAAIAAAAAVTQPQVEATVLQPRTREQVDRETRRENRREHSYRRMENRLARAAIAVTERHGLQNQQHDTQPTAAAVTTAPAAAAAANDDAAAADQMPIEEMLRNVIVHHDRPLENLPVLTPPELKIIGRCVTFTSDTNVGGEVKTLHYEGLVGTINKDTVMLMNVYRFTEEDYAVYKETQQKPADVNKYTRGINTATAPAQTPTPTPTPTQTQMQMQTSTQTRHNAAAAADGAASMGGGDAHMGVGTGLALEREENEALSMVALTHNTEALAHTRGRLKHCPATTGPIPYMTFMRNHIQSVKFGNDPQSSFYSLFHDPSKRFFDMQCLRMFVRRYIVHTSQGNNPRNVPMRAFVVCRCNCPDLDEDLLESVLYEELVHLVKVDRDMKRAQRRRARLRRNSLLNFRAPPGIFRDTGVLYLTGLPRQTLTVAAFEFVVMIGLVVYYGVMAAVAEPYISYRHLFTAVPYLCSCSAATLVASMLSVLHSVRMSIPLSRNYDIVLCRLIMVTVALGCALLLLIVAAQSATLDQTITFVRHQIDQEDVCAYYAQHKCSGLFQACNTSTLDLLECKCDQPITLNNSCRYRIMRETQRIYVPLICFALILATLTFTDHFLHYRLFHAVRLIMHTYTG